MIDYSGVKKPREHFEFPYEKATMKDQPHYEIKPPSALDVQEGGDHYKNRPIQPIEYCHKNNLGPCESAIVKYATRWKDKGGKQDLMKIKHYVDLLIELEGL